MGNTTPGEMAGIEEVNDEALYAAMDSPEKQTPNPVSSRGY